MQTQPVPVPAAPGSGLGFMTRYQKPKGPRSRRPRSARRQPGALLLCTCQGLQRQGVVNPRASPRSRLCPGAVPPAPRRSAGAAASRGPRAWGAAVPREGAAAAAEGGPAAARPWLCPQRWRLGTPASHLHVRGTHSRWRARCCPRFTPQRLHWAARCIPPGDPKVLMF